MRIRTDLNDLAPLAGGAPARALESEVRQGQTRGGVTRRGVDVGDPTRIAGRHSLRAMDIEDRHREDRSGSKLGRAYRAGRLVCGCVLVTVSLEDRLGLTQQERRLMRVRFCEPLDDDLRSELTQLVRRRGAAAQRAAERFDPIELVVDDPHGDPVHTIGRLQPPRVRHGLLRDVEFGLCDLARTR